MLAFCLSIAGLVVYAQDTTSTDQTQTQQQYPTTPQDDQDREKINSRDLPDAVKRSLEATQYRGWLISSAYKTKGVSLTDSQTASGDTTAVSGNQSDTTSVSGNTGVSGSGRGSTGNTSTGNTGVSGTTGDTGAMGEEVFVVELKNGAQTKTVRFDKEGKELDGQGTNNDQK